MNSNLETKFREVESEINRINPKCKLIVVTKEKNPEILVALKKAGALHIGENKMQGLVEKFHFAQAHEMAFEYHLIAPIQTNKISLLTFPFHYHCATELRHLEKMKGKNIELKSCFIQVNISKDPDKAGILPSSLASFLEKAKLIYPINGLMTILEADLTDSEIHKYYKDLKDLADTFLLPEISMGMSHDYLIAAKSGATFIRVGSKIVGSRTEN